MAAASRLKWEPSQHLQELLVRILGWLEREIPSQGPKSEIRKIARLSATHRLGVAVHVLLLMGF